MKTIKASLIASITILSAIGLHTLNRELKPQADKNHESYVNSMDRCSHTAEVMADPLEWIKCVKYSSSYAPLEGEGKYLKELIAFNSEVRREVVRAACAEAPIAHYKKDGYINPETYLISGAPAIVRESLRAQKLRGAGIRVSLETTAPWNWAKFLGASETLSKKILASGSRDHDHEGSFALSEYLDQLRLVIYRNNYKQEIKALCPQKLGDFGRKLG